MLNRGLSFYAVILIGGLVTLCTHIRNVRKYGKDTDKEKQRQELEQAAVDLPADKTQNKEEK